MSLDALAQSLPPFAKDVRLNLTSLTREDALSPQQFAGLLVACGLASRNAKVARELHDEARGTLSATTLAAAEGAATIMAMNNVYYRFTHLAANKAYESMPAKLRMTIIGNPGVDKVDFELWSLAISAMNGCGRCVDSHEKILRDAGVREETIQAAVRTAAVIASAAIATEAATLARTTEATAEAALT